MKHTELANSTNHLDTHIRDITGLPDIFAPSPALNRSCLIIKTKHNTNETIDIDCSDQICRICHGGNSVDNLVKPCNCKGSLALAHLKCLERWLTESNRNYCELCNYHYRIICERKYNYLWSILMFLRYSDHSWKQTFLDFLILIVFTPTTVVSTYMLMLLYENLIDFNTLINDQQSYVVNFSIFSAVFGIAVINLTYASWLMITLEEYINLWKRWYQRSCDLKIVLSTNKLLMQPPSDC